MQEFSWKASDGTSRGTLCTNPKNQPKNIGENLNYGLETYGESSACVEQGKVWDQESCEIIKQWHRYGAGCYGISYSQYILIYYLYNFVLYQKLMIFVIL